MSTGDRAAGAHVGCGCRKKLYDARVSNSSDEAKMSKNLISVFGGRSAVASNKSSKMADTFNLISQQDLASVPEPSRTQLMEMIANATAADKPKLCSYVEGYQMPPARPILAARLLAATTGSGVAQLFAAARGAGMTSFAPGGLMMIMMTPDGQSNLENILGFGSIDALRTLAAWAEAQCKSSKAATDSTLMSACRGLQLRASNMASLVDMAVKNGPWKLGDAPKIPTCEQYADRGMMGRGR